MVLDYALSSPANRVLGYEYTIYRSTITDSTQVVASNSYTRATNGTYNFPLHTIAPANRLENSSSSFLVEVTSLSNDVDYGVQFYSVSGATRNGNLYNPTSIGTNVTITYRTGRLW
jgi:hypothetical protein